MKKIVRRITLCCLFVSVCFSIVLIAERNTLRTNLIRFHVVANSDCREDQETKLMVRDAVLRSIQTDLQKIADIGEAREYLKNNIPKIRMIVDETLRTVGYDGGSVVSLCRERFDIRHYATFSLPSGVYESLRIVIGDGQGQNWWCVSFPALCMPATTSGFQEAAVGAGFSESLVQTLSGDENYEIRFFLLNQLGRLENIFFKE